MGKSTSMHTQLKGQLNFINCFFDVLAVSSGEYYLNKIKCRENVRTYNINIARAINICSDLKAFLSLILLIKKEKPDIVHASSPKASFLSMLASYICRVPIRIYTVTGLRFETTNGWLRKLLILIEKINCFCATKVIPEGEGVKTTIVENKITDKPLNVILNGNINGIDTKFFSISAVQKSKEDIRKDIGLNKSSFVFIFVGRLVKDKGINELIIAFNKLNARCSCTLLLLGELEEVNVISDQSVKEIFNNPSIKYLGYQEDIRPYLKASDVFVLPSYREGFPNVVLQACSMGLPSIVTDISGSNEIINEASGLIIPKEDEQVLYEAMKLTVFDYTTEDLIKMGENARRNVELKFEQKKVWKALLDEYKKCIYE